MAYAGGDLPQRGHGAPGRERGRPLPARARGSRGSRASRGSRGSRAARAARRARGARRARAARARAARAAPRAARFLLAPVHGSPQGLQVNMLDILCQHTFSYDDLNGPC